MAKTSPSTIRAVAKYDKKNTVGRYLKLNVNTDSDIIEHLNGIQNVQGYIKDLIRADMKEKMQEPF